MATANRHRHCKLCACYVNGSVRLYVRMCLCAVRAAWLGTLQYSRRRRERKQAEITWNIVHISLNYGVRRMRRQTRCDGLKCGVRGVGACTHTRVVVMCVCECERASFVLFANILRTFRPFGWRAGIPLVRHADDKVQ